MPKYLGPGDVLSYGGKFYRPGDNVPMNKEEAAHMAANGHRFEGNDPALESGVVLGYTPEPALAMPHDDRGQVVQVPDGRRTRRLSPRR